MDNTTPDLALTIEELTAEVARLRQLVEPDGDTDSAASPAAGPADGVLATVEEPIDRRSALRRAGLMAAGAVTGGAAILAATASPAAAATVSGSGSPGISGTGVGGDGVVGTTTQASASGVYGSTTNANAYGVFARNTAGTALGVEATPPTSGQAAHIRSLNVNPALKLEGKAGVLDVYNTAASTRAAVFVNNSGTGDGVQIVTGGDGIDINGPGHDEATSGVTVFNQGTGLFFGQCGVAMRIQPNGGPMGGPPMARVGQVHAAGSIDYDGVDFWGCTLGGTPGVWRRLTGTGAAGAFTVLPAPARIYDSRPGSVPAVGSKTKLVPNEARTLDLKVNGSTVPAGATAALLTVLLVNAANGNGNATVWANGVAKPQANTLVWGGPAGRFTASAVSALDAQARIQVSASLSTDIVVDVVGYYR